MKGTQEVQYLIITAELILTLSIWGLYNEWKDRKERKNPPTNSNY